MRKNLKKIAAMTMAAAMIGAVAVPQAFGYGETSQTSTLLADTQGTSAYQTWNTTTWTNEKGNSGKIILTPGATEKDLNFAWYSESASAVKLRMSKNEDMSAAKTYTGTSEAISKENIAGTAYTSSNKVSIEGDITPNTTYYYQYSTDAGSTWSEKYSYKSQSSDTYEVILVGDPQIGASGSSGQGTTNDNNIAVDTYNWNKTLTKAMEVAPNAAFILSAGDQIDYSSISGNGYSIRESEYAGYLFPTALRSVPVATTIGNHESKGDDYSLHYNNPNSEDNLGTTVSGGDYYFSYGDTLIISLNSNNRNVEEHRQLLNKAIASNENAKWKVVMFHHDIYGSGSPHSDVDGANLRILFAPLMDEFDIDVCLTGHDHSYARSYQIVDGTAIDYDGTNNVAANPEGTLYIAAGSASGSKFYNLNQTKQYYIAERSNTQIPTFSVIDVTDETLTIKTYDYNGSKYADDFTIAKTGENADVDALIEKVDNIDTTKYTTASLTALKNATNKLVSLMNATATDTGRNQMVSAYDNSLSSDNPNDPVNYTAYAQGEYKNTTSSALKEGFSTLLDKTLYNNDDVTNLLTSTEFLSAYNAVETAITKLETISTGNQLGNELFGSGSNNTDNDATAPQTGDNTSRAIFIIMGVMAGIALASLKFTKKEVK